MEEDYDSGLIYELLKSKPVDQSDLIQILHDRKYPVPAKTVHKCLFLMEKAGIIEKCRHYTPANVVWQLSPALKCLEYQEDSEDDALLYHDCLNDLTLESDEKNETGISFDAGNSLDSESELSSDSAFSSLRSQLSGSDTDFREMTYDFHLGETCKQSKDLRTNASAHSETKKQDKESMVFCDLCEDTEVEVYCLHCDVNLCISCRKVHNKLQLTSEHYVVPISLRNLILQRNNNCEKHSMPFTLLCLDHDDLMCVQCLHLHDRCKYNAIHNVAKNVKESDNFHNLRHEMSYVLSGLDNVCKEINSELSSVKDKVKKLKTTIANYTTQFNEAMNKIEKEGLRLISEHIEHMREVKDRLLKSYSAIENEYHILKALEIGATDKNAFIGMYKADKNIRKCEEDIQTVFKDHDVSSLNFHLNINLQNIPDRIAIIRTKIEMPLLKRLPLDVRINNDKHEMTLEQYRSIDLHKGRTKTDITGCAILQNKEMWFCDHANNNIIISDNKGNIVSEKRLTSSPADIASNNDSVIAVSLPRIKTIAMIDTKNSKNFEHHVINVDSGKLGSLAFNKNNLVVRVAGTGYLVMNSSFDVIRTIKNSEKHMPDLTCANNNLVFSKWDTGKVCCCNIEGKFIWDCSVSEILKPPNGVAADSAGNIFVSGTYSNNIAIVSADGSKCKEISTDIKIINPTALAFDDVNKQLLVICLSGKAILFDVRKVGNYI